MTTAYPHRISVIIAAKDNKQMLGVCLEHLYSQRFDGELEVVVVDNGSMESVAFLVTSTYPQIKLIRNETNLGVAVAFNQALSYITGGNVLSLDQDVELAPDFLDAALNTIRSDEKIGSVAGRLYAMQDRYTEGTLDCAGLMFRNMQLLRVGYNEIDGAHFDQPRYIFAAPGAAALYRREMLRDITIQNKVADEDLFSFLEDLDIGWRAQLRGWKSVYAPMAKAIHKRGLLREKDKQASQDYAMFWSANLSLIRRKNLPENLSKMYRKIIRKNEKAHLLGVTQDYDMVARVQAKSWILRKSKLMKSKNKLIQQSALLDENAQERLLFS